MKKETIYTNIGYGFLLSGLCSLVCDCLKENPFNYINIMGVIGFVLAYVFMIHNGIKLLRILPERIPLNLFSIAIFLVVGGAVSDVAATVICSPGLEQEGNLFLRMLLDIKCPLGLVYLAMAGLNILDISLNLVLFACFLKVYPTLIQSIPYKNILTTLKWIFGIGTLKSWRSILIGKLDFCYFIPSLAVMLVGQCLYRFYMALMWFHKVPHSYYIVPFGIASASFLGLSYFTHYRIKQRKQPAIVPVF